MGLLCHPSPNWIWILDWFGIGLGRLDLGLGLDNIWRFAPYYQFIMTLQSLLFM